MIVTMSEISSLRGHNGALWKALWFQWRRNKRPMPLQQKNTETKTTNIDERERDVRAVEAQINKQYKDYQELPPQPWKHNDYTSPGALEDMYKTYKFVPQSYMY